MKKPPNWVLNLGSEDLEFIKKFILASGSLKEIATLYEVSYPTVRLRLDQLIQRIKLYDKEESEPFTSFVKELALNEKIDLETAKLIIEKYKKVKDGKKNE
ncbi:hypothetical protein BD780_001124 [Clostridium tetanomorphum]|uniref:DUF2089 domain-containing protein n=1 Tax=Clostridium tetanomorphum TaxID=1553 RepID=A0A923EE85_CLOTT|nr:DUF2089 family protein [Clostridium tetanomorphum]KAJ49627.1 hypothetical protein CTM_22078 [Clostridium tetanomorphum DSM 665]KAJ52439.1 hypothetical protein CTM_08071 [Clostridium tetanomorphum DSM 665]MBC2400081.1 DUF2089 domain-containing protein [Clostridium tetanomorphum]MBP1864722.1 hypothetical protein [Clostridium tetanomorphum]NRS83899.1 hypothetical protein [Clostridium tetanomorphum]